jgi:hypothetical protein
MVPMAKTANQATSATVELMEWLKTQILTAPKLAHLVGRGLFSFGGFLVVTGLIGRACMLAVNYTRELGKLPAFYGLVDGYPTIPLWWVPEGTFGYVFAAVLSVAGIYVVLVANTVLKMSGAGRRRRHG